MVLSNKKLKEKLRAAKAELLASQQLSGGDPDSKIDESLKTILKSVAQKPRLSKREKRRVKAQSLQEISAGDGEVGGESGGGDVKGENEGSESEERSKKKRKRGDSDGLESGQEVKAKAKAAAAKKTKKKKQQQKKSKGKIVEGSEEQNEGVKSREEGAAQTIQASERNENADVSTKVYVGGIPYYSNEDDIRSYFEGCGTITEVDCMTFPDTMKFRGIAIINFKTEAASNRALALDGSDMGGLFLKIQPYNSSRVNKVSNFSPVVVEGYNRVYVGNLSWEITEDDLRKLFSDCHITSIRFGEDKETGEFKGYAHVDFADSLSVTTALKSNQKIVCGRPVRVSCAVPKKGAVTKSRSTQRNTQVKSTDDSRTPPQNNQMEMPQSNEADTPHGSQVDKQQSDQSNVDGASTLSAKIRRRTCYECGERGHLSSSCPKVKSADNSKTTPQSNEMDTPQSNQVDTLHSNQVDKPQSDQENVVGASTLSAKIRRRTCYECGERGHLSSSCPKKQAAEQGNQFAS